MINLYKKISKQKFNNFNELEILEIIKLVFNILYNNSLNLPLDIMNENFENNIYNTIYDIIYRIYLNLDENVKLELDKIIEIGYTTYYSYVIPIRSFKNTFITKYKNINQIKKNINYINNKESIVVFEKKQKFYDLIILSTGSFSNLYFKIDEGRSIKKNYEEFAITSIIKHNAKIKNPSQFFLKEGPLAILPLKENLFSLVWSVNKNFFITHKKNLKKTLTIKLKTLLKVNKIEIVKNINFFPINLNLKTKYFKKNVLILGDGLHSVHPIAGQGFNLVLRDIKKLTELMSETMKLGLLFRNSFLLKDFYNSRKPENNLFGLGINFTKLFFKDHKYLRNLKKGILNNLNNFGFIKKISQSMADRGILL